MDADPAGGVGQLQGSAVGFIPHLGGTRGAQRGRIQPWGPGDVPLITVEKPKTQRRRERFWGPCSSTGTEVPPQAPIWGVGTLPCRRPPPSPPAPAACARCRGRCCWAPPRWPAAPASWLRTPRPCPRCPLPKKTGGGFHLRGSTPPSPPPGSELLQTPGVIHAGGRMVSPPCGTPLGATPKLGEGGARG